MKYTITIPEPCHENWNEMTPTDQGKFCGSCEKEVIDFSNSSMAKLSKKIDIGSKLCGRFRPEQLNRPIRSTKGNAIRQRGILVAAVTLLAAASPIAAQSQDPAPVKLVPKTTILGRIAVQPKQIVKPVTTEYITVSGVVRSGQNILMGAKILVKGADINAKTDKEGKFEISIQAEKVNASVILQVSHFDYEAREIEIHKTATSIDIELAFNGFIMGDIMIEENPNLIERVGRVFKKKDK